MINHSSDKLIVVIKSKKPGKDYFLTVDQNLMKVVRPRDHKLLKKIKIFEKDYLWRTFSQDQIDLVKMICITGI